MSQTCNLQSVNVTIAGARLNADGAASPGSTGWVDVALPAPVRVDLLALAAGAALPQVLAGLPDGSYRQMRLLLATGDAASPLADSVVGATGVETALAVPGSAQGGLPMAVDITVAEGRVSGSWSGMAVCQSVTSVAGVWSLDAVPSGATRLASAI
jgi:hypothetical protein